MGVDSGVVNRTAGFVKPSSVDLSITTKALKVRCREFRVLGVLPCPNTIGWQNDAWNFFFWDKMGKDHLGFECAQASLLMGAVHRPGGYQALLSVYQGGAGGADVTDTTLSMGQDHQEG